MSNSVVWKELLENILNNGKECWPAGKETKELLGHQTVWDMNQPIIHVPERKLSYKFLFAEAAWILGGGDKVATISPYNKRIKDYSDDGVTFFGAYGPKVRGQLDYVYQQLVADYDTRRANLTIWRENPPETKDYPCTISLQWMIRDNQLHCFDTMRSSDAWWGVPYDVFNMSAISYALLMALRLGPGKYENLGLGNLYLTASSQHLYQPFFDEAASIVEIANLTPATATLLRSPTFPELFEGLGLKETWPEVISNTDQLAQTAANCVATALGVLADQFRFKQPEAVKQLK